jgi:pilus assembly protein Flp/PilA
MQKKPNEIRGLNRNQGKVQSVLGGFVRCENGATAIEYGLICSLIFMAIVVSVQGVASATTALHTKVGGSLQ